MDRPARLFRRSPDLVMMTINGKVVVPPGAMDLVDEIAASAARTALADDAVVSRADNACPKSSTLDVYPIGDTTFRGDPVVISTRGNPIVAPRGAAERKYSNFRNCTTIRTQKHGFRMYKTTGSVQGFGFTDTATFHELVDVACTALLGTPCHADRAATKISLAVLNVDIDKSLFPAVRGAEEFPMRLLAMKMQTMAARRAFDIVDFKFDPNTRADVVFVTQIPGVAKAHVLMKACGNLKINMSGLQKPLAIVTRETCERVKTILNECLEAIFAPTFAPVFAPISEPTVSPP